MKDLTARRTALKAFGLGLAASGVVAAAQANAASEPLLPEGARTLKELTTRLEAAPRRRDFKTVPMILTEREQWDHVALSEVMAYRGSPKQVWDDNTLDGPWLNLKRNALNAQVFSYRHPDFLCVAAVHGTAHLALLDQAMWEKYSLSKLAGEKYKTNTFIVERSAEGNPKDIQNPEGVYSGKDLSIPYLQRRGVVFLACHNSLWELSERLIKMGINPDKLSHEAMCAELTNHLIPGAVLTPGIVATLPELQRVGFHYAK
jgi:hypothetical protein